MIEQIPLIDAPQNFSHIALIIRFEAELVRTYGLLYFIGY
jgi:hypothetical protein